MRSLGVAWVVVVGVAALPAGCVAPEPVRPDAWLSAAPRPYERDIPLPVGFRLIERSSEDWSSGSLRYVRHRYLGRADQHAVRRFYHEQMPLVRWTEVSGGRVGGRTTMQFQRGAESCTVTIENVPGGSPGEVIAEVLIAPSTR